MIPRYTRPEMAKIWDERNEWQTMLDVEIAACEANAEPVSYTHLTLPTN